MPQIYIVTHTDGRRVNRFVTVAENHTEATAIIKSGEPSLKGGEWIASTTGGRYARI